MQKLKLILGKKGYPGLLIVFSLLLLLVLFVFGLLNRHHLRKNFIVVEAKVNDCINKHRLGKPKYLYYTYSYKGVLFKNDTSVDEELFLQCDCFLERPLFLALDTLRPSNIIALTSVKQYKQFHLERDTVPCIVKANHWFFELLQREKTNVN